MDKTKRKEGAFLTSSESIPKPSIIRALKMASASASGRLGMWREQGGADRVWMGDQE